MYYYYIKRLYYLMLLWKQIFFRIIWWINKFKEVNLFKIEIEIEILHNTVFTITDQLNASLLNLTDQTF